MTETYDTCFLHLFFFMFPTSKIGKVNYLQRYSFLRANILDSQRSEASTNTKLARFRRSKLIIFWNLSFLGASLPLNMKVLMSFLGTQKKLDHITIVELRDAEDMMVSGALLATWILLGIRRSNSISGEPGPIDHPEKLKTIFLSFQIRYRLFHGPFFRFW